MKGTVTKVDDAHQSGEIRGDDGKIYIFERDGMALSLRFDALQPGTPVTFDVAGTKRAENIARQK